MNHKATELPPKRTHDHKISLVEGIPLVNMRPYMHPPIQKDAIEAMVKELLEAGVIKPSHIPFASPIVMVKKKDNTWRMCIDYRITTPLQMKWLPKLMGFDYEVKYKKGVENAAADALSMNGKEEKKHYSWSNGQLLRKNKMVVGKDEQLRLELLAYFHGSSAVRHSGVKVTTYEYKPDLAAYPGLLKPLHILDRIWDNISMDFIEGLPKSQGSNVIFLVVARLTKFAHFMTLAHPNSAAQVTQLFLDTVYKLHGLPTTIVSYRDKIF
ncbi:retrotransposable element Tf2 [Tanacetum coccineum]